MSDAPFLSDDDPPSLPSELTMRVGGTEGPLLGRVDQYDLVRKLGGGGFGVVYLARDTASGVEVAIKTLHPLLKHNAEEMDNLREKFALVSRLAHTNIATALVLHPVRVIDLFDETVRRELKLSAGDSVMVMRYAPGVTLSKWRRQFPGGVVPLDRVLEIGRQVAAALDYAHGEKIVHRDVKPANIMVETREDGRVVARLLDFGLAAEIRSSMSRVSTEAGDTSGTRPYMAPEQWLGKKQDGRTDQYALACVLYELLSGAPPFAGVFETGDPMIMMATVKGEAPDEIEESAPAVNAALLRALAKNPKDRFPSCTAFVEALALSEDPPKDTEDMDEATIRSSPARTAGASSSVASKDVAVPEAAVILRKVKLARSLSSLTDEDRKDSGIFALAAEAEERLAAVDESLKFSQFAAAMHCMDLAETTMNSLLAAVNARRLKVHRAELLGLLRHRGTRLSQDAARHKQEQELEKARKRAEAEKAAWKSLQAKKKAEQEAFRRAFGGSMDTSSAKITLKPHPSRISLSLKGADSDKPTSGSGFLRKIGSAIGDFWNGY